MRHLLTAAAIALPLLGVAAPASAQTHAYESPAYASGSMNVALDQAAKVSFAGPARDVVVGNPAVADVTMIGASSAVVLGKSYGVTNISAFDAAGRTVFSRQVVVAPNDDARVVVYRGAQSNSFACAAACERITTTSGAAAPAAAPAPATP